VSTVPLIRYGFVYVVHEPALPSPVLHTTHTYQLCLHQVQICTSIINRAALLKISTKIKKTVNEDAKALFFKHQEPDQSSTVYGDFF
jgi:hypothetical protein